MISETRQAQILMEETVPRRERKGRDTPEEAVYRRSVRRDIRKLKQAGAEVVIPSTQPDARPGTRS